MKKIVLSVIGISITFFIFVITPFKEAWNGPLKVSVSTFVLYFIMAIIMGLLRKYIIRPDDDDEDMYKGVWIGSILLFGYSIIFLAVFFIRQI